MLSLFSTFSESKCNDEMILNFTEKSGGIKINGLSILVGSVAFFFLTRF